LNNARREGKKIMTVLVAGSTFFAQKARWRGNRSFRRHVALNKVKDLMLGSGLHKLNRVTHDHDRGPSLCAG
jgi:hypothetical protein